MTEEKGRPDTEVAWPGGGRQETGAARKRRRDAEMLRESRAGTNPQAVAGETAAGRIKKNKKHKKNTGKRKKTLDVSLFVCYP